MYRPRSADEVMRRVSLSWLSSASTSITRRGSMGLRFEGQVEAWLDKQSFSKCFATCNTGGFATDIKRSRWATENTLSGSWSAQLSLLRRLTYQLLYLDVAIWETGHR